jgi:iron complex outermembrane receptor protein
MTVVVTPRQSNFFEQPSAPLEKKARPRSGMTRLPPWGEKSMFAYMNRRSLSSATAMVAVLTAMATTLSSTACAEEAANASASTDSAAATDAAAAAPGGTADTGQLGDIVVTANKRSQNLQDVPIAITAIQSAALSGAGINNTQDLTQVVPGLVAETSMNGMTVHLRGVGTSIPSAGLENSVATYIDGVYVMSMVGSIMNLSSIQQVEVLKGPQGTLFGRNATGGVISIKTRDPQYDLGGNADLRYGNYETVEGKVYVTGGLTDNLAVDFAGYGSFQGKGWGKNLFSGKEVHKTDEYTLRSKALFTPTDVDEFRFAVDYSHVKSSHLNAFKPTGITNYGPGTTLAGQRPDLAPYVASGALNPNAEVGDPYVFRGGFWDLDTFSEPRARVKSGGASLQWNHDFGGVRFQSITAYRQSRLNQYWSSTTVPAFRGSAGWEQNDHQVSQELQLASKPGDTVQWVGGLYYLKTHSSYDPFIVEGLSYFPIRRLSFYSSAPGESGAIFGQATFPIVQDTNVTLGLRYTIEKKSVSGNTVISFVDPNTPDLVVGVTDTSKVFRKLTWRGALDHKFSDNVLGYVSVNRGFKSGGYDTVPVGGPTAKPAEPEVLDAYEAGLKTELFDRRVRLNVAAFRYDYSQIQVSITNTVSNSIVNGAKARIYGAEFDLLARVTDRLTISGGASVLDSKFLSFPNADFRIPLTLAQGGGNLAAKGDAKGNKLPYAPEFTANVGVNYTAPLADGEIAFDANYTYNDGYFTGPDNIQHQSAYQVVNGSLTYTLPNETTQIGIWGKNLFNEKYYVFLLALSNPGAQDEGVTAAPRTYGISLSQKF